MISFLRLGCLASLLLSAQVDASEIEHVLAHPPYAGYYVCGEHYQGQLPYLGDDLGSDCIASELVTSGDRTWSRTHTGDGTKNDDWFSWRAQLYSPCDCEVVKIHINPVVNEPGILGKPPASFIALRRDDGVMFMLAHIQEPSIEVGDHVSYGQPIALVGNNGYGRTPHVHVGAWKGETAFQIRWDQRHMSDAGKEPQDSDS